jgi:DNA-binding CsgD family transcriptional regulator
MKETVATGSSRVLRVFNEQFNTALVFGSACCLAWLLIALRAMVLLATSPDALSLHIPFYLWLATGASAALLAGGVFHRVTDRLLTLRSFRFIPAAAMTCATALMVPLTILQTLQPGINTEILSGICGALAGLGFGILFFQWGSVWYTQGFKTIVFSAVTAWCLCELLFLIFLYLDQTAAILGAALLPLASALLLRYAQLHITMLPPFGRSSARISKQAVARLALFGFLFGFVNEFIRLTYIQRGAGGLSPLSFAGTNSLSLLLMFGVVFVGVFLPILRKTNVRFESLYRILLLLAVLGVLLILIPETPPILSYATNMTAYLCLGFIIWATTICLCRKHPRSTTFIFGLTQAAWMAGPLISAQLNHELFAAELMPDSTLIVIGGVCALVAVYCFIFKEADIAMITVEGRTGDFDEKCAHIAYRYRLSERETQVLVFIAKGRDIVWIKERLCLSKSTVSTHRQHVYEKLGIHTRQELIDMIEDM